MPTLLELLDSHQNNPKDKRVFGLVLESGATAANLKGKFDHIVGSGAEVLHEVQPFVDKKTRFHIVMIDVKTGDRVVVSKPHHITELLEESRVSHKHNKTFLIGERWYKNDRTESLPLDLAIKLGCTDIVVVMAQQIKNYHFHNPGLVKQLTEPHRKYRLYALEPNTDMEEFLHKEITVQLLK